VQNWTVLPRHCFAPGAQTPVQEPAAQTNGQVEPDTHWPLASQERGTLPWQSAAPGEQIPVQVPVWQIDGQLLLCQWPVASHV